MNIAGKKVLLTGASGGIGRSIALHLDSLGVKLTISGSNEEKLSNLSKKLSDNAVAITRDLNDLNSVQSLVDDARSALGGLDGLVCNAGITDDKIALRMNLESWQKVIDVNLTSTFLLNKQACKLMMKQNSGRIINVSSIVGFTGNPGQINYSASKAGIVGMTKSFAAEFAQRKININCIAPGYIETEMTSGLDEEWKDIIRNEVPMKRFGKPEDVSGAIAFLLSNLSNYITGQTIHINGGLRMY